MYNICTYYGRCIARNFAQACLGVPNAGSLGIHNGPVVSGFAAINRDPEKPVSIGFEK